MSKFLKKSDDTVPSKNSTDNEIMSQVIGNKTDDENGDSLYSKLYKLDTHVHSGNYIYPEKANSITLTKAIGVWADYPASKTEIIPVNTIIEPFDLHYVIVDTISANGSYVIRFYKGLAGAEILIGMIGITRSAVASNEGSIPIQTGILPANTRISAALTSENNAANTANVKVFYHTY